MQTASEIARYAHLVMHGATEAERLEGTAAFRKVLSAGKQRLFASVTAFALRMRRLAYVLGRSD